jgi:putative redox protein
LGFLQQVTAGHHTLVVDEPVAAGGTDRGAGPYDFLLAALGACTSMTLAMYARRKEWPLTDVVVRLRHSRVHSRDCADCETSDGHLDRIDREITMIGELSDEQRERLGEIADKCPVHRTLTSETKIRTTIIKG